MPGSHFNQASVETTAYSPSIVPMDSTALAADRLLIIDDSSQISSMLVTGIIKACDLGNRPYRIVQSGPSGLIEANSGVGFHSSEGGEPRPPLIIYTANSPRNALPVLRLPGLHRLIIVSDIMMPSDTEVGLIGLMQDLAARRLPVSLVFASSEKQNRYYVDEILQSGKARFIEKGSPTWGDLPFLLVQHTQRFQYKVILLADFDRAQARNSDSASTTSRHNSLRLETTPVSTVAKDSLWSRLAFWKKKR